MKLPLVKSLLVAVPMFAAAPAVAHAEAPPTARVHMEGADGLGLEALGPGDTVWSLVCRAPCDLTLPIDALYRVTGAKIETSRAFRIDASPGGYAVLDVKPRSRSAHEEGIVVAAVGGVAVGVGVASVIAYAVIGAGDSLCTSLDQPDSLGGCADPDQSPPRGLLIGGIVTAVIGGIVLATGFAVAQPTTVEQGRPAHDDPGEPSRPREHRWARLPLWREARAGALTLPAVNAVPLFTTTF